MNQPISVWIAIKKAAPYLFFGVISSYTSYRLYAYSYDLTTTVINSEISMGLSFFFGCSGVFSFIASFSLLSLYGVVIFCRNNLMMARNNLMMARNEITTLINTVELCNTSLETIKSNKEIKKSLRKSI